MSLDGLPPTTAAIVIVIYVGYGLLAMVLLITRWGRWLLALACIVLADLLAGSYVLPLYGHQPWMDLAAPVVAWADATIGRQYAALALLLVFCALGGSTVPKRAKPRERQAERESVDGCPFNHRGQVGEQP